MAYRNWRALVSAAIGAAAFTVAGGANAGGVIVKAHYDPPAFVGDATFDIDSSCLSGVADGVYFAAGSCTIAMTGNVVTDPSPPAPIDFGPLFTPTPDSADIISFVVIGEKLVGVNTDLIGIVTQALVSYAFDFQSLFDPGSPPGCDVNCFGPFVTNSVRLFDSCFDTDGVFCTKPEAFLADEVTFFTPEPGSIGLILGALGAGWLARRRKVAA